MQRNRETVQEDLQLNKSSGKHTNTQTTKTQTQRKDLELSSVDHVSANVQSSRSHAMLYIFEDNEAVIKMIIKGRSPTMRHVSRTHRVAPSCFAFERDGFLESIFLVWATWNFMTDACEWFIVTVGAPETVTDAESSAAQ